MGKDIIIDSDGLGELSGSINDLVNNNSYLLNAISPLRQQIIEQSLYGVEKAMRDKLVLYENYISNYYMETLYTIQDNISKVGSTFDEQDIANKKGLL